MRQPCCSKTQSLKYNHYHNVHPISNYFTVCKIIHLGKAIKLEAILTLSCEPWGQCKPVLMNVSRGQTHDSMIFMCHCRNPDYI